MLNSRCRIVWLEDYEVVNAFVIEVDMEVDIVSRIEIKVDFEF